MKFLSCMTCIKNNDATTSFTIRSKCFNKPITFNIENDNEKLKVLQDLIFTLIGDNEPEKQKLKLNLSNKENTENKEKTNLSTIII